MSEIGKRLSKMVKGFRPPVCPVALRPDVLLTGGLPAPMHGLAPRVVLGQTWWDKERKEAAKRTNDHCIACGVHKTLAKGGKKWIEGHEVYEIDWLKGTMKYLRTEPLCNFCHEFTHTGRLKALLDAKKISHGHYVAVVQHGQAILQKAGLKREDRPVEVAGWGRWRLVVGRKKYKGLFKNEAEWVAYHKEKNNE